MEKIITAAIQLTGNIIITIQNPGRHSDLMRYLASNGYGLTSMSNQGFLTSDGRFVDRSEGHDIALSSGQTTDTDKTQLYTEDLW